MYTGARYQCTQNSKMESMKLKTSVLLEVKLLIPWKISLKIVILGYGH